MLAIPAPCSRDSNKAARASSLLRNAASISFRDSSSKGADSKDLISLSLVDKASPNRLSIIGSFLRMSSKLLIMLFILLFLSLIPYPESISWSLSILRVLYVASSAARSSLLMKRAGKPLVICRSGNKSSTLSYTCFTSLTLFFKPSTN